MTFLLQGWRMRSMSNRVERLQAGFTLVELMVAVALATIILAIAVTVFAQGSRVAALMHARSEAMHNAWVGLEMFEKDLQAACINPDGGIFLGVYDTSRGGVDNDRDGAVDEAGETTNDFSLTRQGVEFLTTHGMPTAEGTAHVLYYVVVQGTTPGGTDVGRLIRYVEPCGSAAVSQFIGAGLAGGDSEDVQAVASGLTQFRLRYFCDGQWFDPAQGEAWDSQDPDGWDKTDDDLQFRRMPRVIEVTLTVVDSDWLLDKEEMPVEIHRLIVLPED